jgi:hypothetical protein
VLLKIYLVAEDGTRTSPLFQVCISQDDTVAKLKELIAIRSESLLLSVPVYLEESDVRTYVHTYIRIYIHACMHAYRHIYIYTYIHTWMHTYENTYMHVYMHTHLGTCGRKKHLYYTRSFIVPRENAMTARCELLASYANMGNSTVIAGLVDAMHRMLLALKKATSTPKVCRLMILLYKCRLDKMGDQAPGGWKNDPALLRLRDKKGKELGSILKDSLSLRCVFSKDSLSLGLPRRSTFEA